MGFWQTFRDKNAILGPVRREQNFIQKKVQKMLKAHHLTGRQRAEVDEQLQHLKQLACIEALAPKMVLSPKDLEKREQLLNKYQVGNGPEAINYLVGTINGRYNRGDTDDARWLDLRGLLYEYEARNYREVIELEDLGREANRLQAPNLADRANVLCQELQKEEENLREMVWVTRPENFKGLLVETDYANRCNFAAHAVQKKIDLYRIEGRTPLLLAYKGHIRDCGGDPQKIEQGILAAERYWSQEGRRFLQDLTQAARESRRETPVVGLESPVHTVARTRTEEKSRG